MGTGFLPKHTLFGYADGYRTAFCPMQHVKPHPVSICQYPMYYILPCTWSACSLKCETRKMYMLTRLFEQHLRPQPRLLPCSVRSPARRITHDTGLPAGCEELAAPVVAQPVDFWTAVRFRGGRRRHGLGTLPVVLGLLRKQTHVLSAQILCGQHDS